MENTKNNGDLRTSADIGSVEAACELFESDFKCGKQPEIEHFLAGWDEPERSKLLYELLCLEIQHRYAHGQPYSRDDYLARFADHREVVDEALQCTVAPEFTEETLTLSLPLRRRRWLGEGGLGVVYIAEDQLLQRDTAVKFIRDALKNDARSQEQFRLEAEITSRLEHPGIVPVHGLGKTADGRLFYVMRLVCGEGFQTAIAKYYKRANAATNESFDRHVSFHDLLNHFVSVCKTIAYAHNRGIVHRDLKPGNIMLGRYGETQVIDWGLGAHVGRKGVFKDSSEKTLMPSAGSSSSQNSGGGTPPYMSPEQAAGCDDLGPLSDIYSLGATLYTVITGQVPFVGSPTDIMDKVKRGAFRRPTQVRAGLSKALEAICLKAMSLDPQHRYTTALELANDVERYLADAPVLAYQEPAARRLARWTRRHRTTAQVGLAAMLMLAISGALAALWMGRQAHIERQLRQVAETAGQREQAQRKQGLQLSAIFAAQSIANQIDLRWRALEQQAANPKLHELLIRANTQSSNQEFQNAIQEWLQQQVSQGYSELVCRAWNVYTRDGTLVARHPSTDETGKRARSIGRNFSFRDYFHGRKQDFSPNLEIAAKPLRWPHNSAVFRSMTDNKLIVMLSVPIEIDVATSNAVDGTPEPLGIFAMSIELGRFGDQLMLPDAQLLMVESRKYYMLNDDDEPKGPRGEGMVLHHKDVEKFMSQKSPPRIADAILDYVGQKTASVTGAADRAQSLDNLLPDTYSDPLTKAPCLAAFAPIIVSSRPAQQQDTGWFVVVQQEQKLAPGY
jgi:serine/threonine-protein kinase